MFEPTRAPRGATAAAGPRGASQSCWSAAVEAAASNGWALEGWVLASALVFVAAVAPVAATTTAAAAAALVAVAAAAAAGRDGAAEN